MRQFFQTILLSFLIFFMNQVKATDLKGIEQDLSDTVITTKIKTKFAKNKNLNPLKISVSTHNGVVILQGHAKDKHAFVDALRIATSTKGVKTVNTEQFDMKRVNTTFTDTYITAKIEAAILEAKVLDDESIPLVGINASTINGIVTLTGSVENSKSIDAILKRANNVHGVKKIISNLNIKKT